MKYWTMTVRDTEAAVGTRIYLATAKGLAVITASSEGWRGEMQLKGFRIRCIAVDPDRPGVLLCGSFGNGVFRSDDAGASWRQCEGTEGKKVMAVTARRAGEVQRVYAGMEPSELLRSDDDTQSWHPLSSFSGLPSASTWSFPPRPNTHHVRYILLDPHVPRRLHIAIEAGALLRSDDEGETWRDRVIGSPKDTHTLAAHPERKGWLYSAAGDGYFESRDDGDSWQRVSDGLEHTYCWSVAIGSADPETILLTASRTPGDAHAKSSANTFVYRRTQGQSWQPVQNGLPASQGRRIGVLAASRVEPGVFYLSSEGEIYRSADDGEHWQLLPVQWAEGSQPEHALDMQIVESAEGTA